MLNTLSVPNAPQTFLLQIDLYANICSPPIFQKISFLTWVTVVKNVEYEGKHLSELFPPAKSPSSKWSSWRGGQTTSLHEADGGEQQAAVCVPLGPMLRPSGTAESASAPPTRSSGVLGTWHPCTQCITLPKTVLRDTVEMF